MGTRGLDPKRVEIVTRLCHGKEFGKLSRHEKSKVVIDAFKEVGREVEEFWSFESVNKSIPFVYISHPSEEAWNGIASFQSWEKFKRGQESQFTGISLDQKLLLIRNYLKIYYGYTGPDRLSLEVSESAKQRDIKISLYCDKHGWNDPVNLTSVIYKELKQSCTRCEFESKIDGYRIDIKEIIELWNSLDRIVGEDAIYVNNSTQIPFYSKKYEWQASQSWQSFQMNFDPNQPSRDPHDTRTLIDKPGYLAKLLQSFNCENNTAYQIDPDWLIPEDIGPASQIQLLAPEWRNFAVEMNWSDFFNLGQKPIFKSIINQTGYIKLIASETGRQIIPEDWKYNGDAHSLITFVSPLPRYSGMIFANSWNQISNRVGFSVQAMVNKQSFFGDLLSYYGIALEKPINDRLPMSQFVSAMCEEGHEVFRPLSEFRRSPETFCLTCFERKPDCLSAFAKNLEHASGEAFVYFVKLVDIDGTYASKIGITNKPDVSKRFNGGTFAELFFSSSSVGRLTRAEAFVIESLLLVDTQDFPYEKKFYDDESRQEQIEGWSELRDLSLPKDWVIDLFKKYFGYVKEIGWVEVALQKLKTTSKEKELLRCLQR